MAESSANWWDSARARSADSEDDEPDIALRPMPSWCELATQAIDDSLIHVGDGFLEVGGFLLLVGASYAGKSTFLAQLSMNMACGRPWLFFTYKRPLRILTVQAEDSINKQRRLGRISQRADFSSEELKLIDRNTAVLTIRDLQDEKFFIELTRHVKSFKPDIIIINPMTSYVGKGVYNDEPINAFLRVSLMPLLDAQRISAIVAHHPPKPGQKDINDMSAFEIQYAGSGMAAITNASRSTLLLSHVDGNVFKLQAGKGFEELGGGQQPEVHIQRDKDCEGRMLWTECSAEGIAFASANRAAHKGGRPKRHTVEKLLEILGDRSLSTVEFQKECLNEKGIPKTNFYDLLEVAENAKKIFKSPLDNTWSTTP